jgi:hypothetical protein
MAVAPAAATTFRKLRRLNLEREVVVCTGSLLSQMGFWEFVRSFVSKFTAVIKIHAS